MASKDSNSDLRAASRQAEPTESAANGGGSTTHSRQGSGAINKTQTPQSSTTTASVPLLRKLSSTNLTPQVSSPLAQSPGTSRNTSPSRKDHGPASSATSLSSQPSAAAIQRALSASSVPQLQQQAGTGAVTEAVSKLPRAPRSTTASGNTTPQWPASPRLKSPPPSGPPSRRGSAAAPKKPDSNTTPSISILSSTPQSNTSAVRQTGADNQQQTPQLQPPPPPKASARGASGKSVLETVQENSADAQEPSPAAKQAAADLKPLTKMGDAKQDPKKDASPKADDQKHAQTGESGSESAGNKSDSKSKPTVQGSTPAQQQRPANTTAKHSYTPSAGKPRGDGKQNMTVETETVQSIPQSGLAPAGEGANRMRASEGGSVKLKPSTETIRPKKERKRNERKTRSINQGSATSKADLFEARVANAVDEANTSDSDETFVYESNPPEPQRRQTRHHSRTPSVASAHSTADQQRGVGRHFADPFGDDRRVGGKRSMKFSSNPYNELDSPESKDGTMRSHTPRHIGRYGRGGHHSASYDQDSPFTQASKLRQNRLGRSRPNSPKSPQSMQVRTGGLFSSNKKQESPYDFDAEQNADDERTPLMPGTIRTNRGYRPGRRIGSSNAPSFEDYADQPRAWWRCSGRVSSCIVTTFVIMLVVVAAIGFVFASNRPLYNVEIHEIKNVLATEQELMLDLVVGAVNPNALGITVADLDVNIFAKSKHVGSGIQAQDRSASNVRQRRKAPIEALEDNPNPSQDPSGHWHTPHHDGELEKDAQTMLLGRIFHFDQALIFDASPIKQHLHHSSGQVRLKRPGNETESGGSARWEKVIQYPFELIVRGVLKYQLPISSRQQKAAVGASMMVHPEEGIDKWGNMRVEPVDHSEQWQWIDWPDVLDDEDDDLEDARMGGRVLGETE